MWQLSTNFDWKLDNFYCATVLFIECFYTTVSFWFTVRQWITKICLQLLCGRKRWFVHGSKLILNFTHKTKNSDSYLWELQQFVKGSNKYLIRVLKSRNYLILLLQALKAAGQVWLLSNMDSQEDIAYPNDPRVPIKVDNDLKDIFFDIELPRDMLDIEKDLAKNGFKPATNTAKRRAAAQIHGVAQTPKPKKKKQEISKRTKLTNAHLPELFQNLNNSSKWWPNQVQDFFLFFFLVEGWGGVLNWFYVFVDTT